MSDVHDNRTAPDGNPELEKKVELDDVLQAAGKLLATINEFFDSEVAKELATRFALFASAAWLPTAEGGAFSVEGIAALLNLTESGAEQALKRTKTPHKNPIKKNLYQTEDVLNYAATRKEKTDE